ncbi:uncharacterized protein [Procambarus clarkii]|uniref:uncharacterized protein isoform X1 n=1 Tax=Procambarus clarkii TaxID=6728 RepID=UPI0037420198
MEDAARDARVMECSANNGSATVTNSDEVHKVQGGHCDQRRYHGKPNSKFSREPHHTWSHGTRLKQSQRLTSEGVNNKCYNCGGDYPHQDNVCPAQGKKCYECGKLGHFGAMCRSALKKPQSMNKSTVRRSGHRCRGGKHNIAPHIQNVNNVQDNISLQPVSDDSECDYTYGVQAITEWNDLPNNPETIVYIAGICLKVLIDTGSNIDTIAECHYEKFKKQFPKLENYNGKATAYASKVALPVIGTFTAEIKSKSAMLTTTFHVVRNAKESLLSYKTSTKLGHFSFLML